MIDNECMPMNREMKQRFVMYAVAILLAANLPIWPVIAFLGADSEYPTPSLEFHALSYIAEKGFYWEANIPYHDYNIDPKECSHLLRCHVHVHYDTTLTVLILILVSSSFVLGRVKFRTTHVRGSMLYARRLQ